MKILITGINGQLGHDVAEAAVGRGYSVVGTDVTENYGGITNLACTLDRYVKMDITDESGVASIVAEVKPDVIVHCAAWTAVDKAEDEECRDTVMRVNCDGTRSIAKACRLWGCKLIFISTDYVFDGEGDKPWKPDFKSFRPINQYGTSKLMAERAVEIIHNKFFVVRISWVYGINGGNFVKTMLKLSANHDSLKVVNDQIGLPTYTRDLSELLLDMAETERYGYYHACNTGDYISWYDFACGIFDAAGVDMNVIPVSTEEYGLSKAARPKNSRMDTSKLTDNGFSQLPEWKDALTRYMDELRANKML